MEAGSVSIVLRLFSGSVVGRVEMEAEATLMDLQGAVEDMLGDATGPCQKPCLVLGLQKLDDFSPTQTLSSIGVCDAATVDIIFARRITVASASGNDAAIFDLKKGTKLQTFVGHVAPVNCAAFSPDGLLLAAGSEDGVAKVWNIESNVATASIDGHEDAITCIAFAPNNIFLATGGEDMSACVWIAETGAQIARVSIECCCAEGGIHAVAFSPDSSCIALGGEGGSNVQLVQLERGHRLCEIECSHDVGAIAFSPDGLSLVFGSDDGTFQHWYLDHEFSAPRLKCILAQWPERCEGAMDVAFSPDGCLIAAFYSDEVSGGSYCGVWNTISGEYAARLPEIDLSSSNIATFVSLSQDSLLLMTGSGILPFKISDEYERRHQGSVKLWSLSDGQCVLSHARMGDAVLAVLA